jgi:hypothetical protein
MSDDRGGRAPLLVHASMYGCALLSGVLLVLVGHATTAEASGFVSPFLVVFEGRSRLTSSRERKQEAGDGDETEGRVGTANATGTITRRPSGTE